MQATTCLDIRATIERAAPELRAAGIAALYLFGSQARGDASEESDIVFLFEVKDEANARFSLLDQASLIVRLEGIFDRKVDFVERRALRPRIRERIESEMVRLF